MGELLATRRLVTVCGPGGVGKTRLALEVAWDLADWLADGASMVELAGVRDALAVPATIATALRVPETAMDGPLEALIAVLELREVLLVLDNCEHVIDSAADLVLALLSRTTATRVLATSREPLRIAGEAVFRLDPLSFPDTVEAGVGDALELFVTRAKEANRRFALRDGDAQAAVELMRRIDGLPLAIELVAAHASAFNTAELLARLNSQPELLVRRERGGAPRHRSLHAAIEWSDSLLTTEQGRVFYQLGVFAGGCTLDAAERVCAGPGDAADANVSEALRALIDKSLVVARWFQDGTRYLLLDTVRRYAADRLAAEEGAQAIHAALIAWLLDLTIEAGAGLDGPQRSVWLRRLERELDNIGVGLNWAIEHDPPAALRLASSLSRWWRTAGRLAEGRRWLEAALIANPSRPLSDTATALLELGLILQDQGDVVGSLSVHREALEAAQSANDGELTTRALVGVAQALRDSGDYDAAADQAERAVTLARDRTDSRGQIRALAALAFIGVYRGDFNKARELAQQAVLLRKEDDSSAEVWDAIAASAIANCWAGALDVAQAHANRALTLGERSASPTQIAWSHSTLAAIAGMRRNAAEEITHSRQCLDLSVDIGAKRTLFNAVMCLGHASGLTGNYELGATLAGASSAIVRQAGFTLPPGFDRYLRLDSYAATLGIDPRALESAYQTGQTLTTPEVIDLALTVTPPDQEDRVAAKRTIERLSSRERQLIRLVADGLTDAQIGERLFISIRTVRSHLDRIRDKTGARRRAELTRLATSLGPPDTAPSGLEAALPIR